MRRIASLKKWCEQAQSKWYNLTAPPLPSPQAHFMERELARQSRVTSTTLFIVILALLIAFPVPIAAHNWALLMTFIIALGIMTFALVCNRYKHLLLAGALVVGAMEISMAIAVLSVGTLSTYTLPVFDLMIQPECVAASLLPPMWVLIVATNHCLFLLGCLLWMPKTQELAAILHVSGYDVFLRAATIVFVVAGVLFVWARSHQKLRHRLLIAEAEAETNRVSQRSNRGPSKTDSTFVQTMQIASASRTLVGWLLRDKSLAEWEQTDTPVDDIVQWIIRRCPSQQPSVDSNSTSLSSGEPREIKSDE